MEVLNENYKIGRPCKKCATVIKYKHQGRCVECTKQRNAENYSKRQKKVLEQRAIDDAERVKQANIRRAEQGLPLIQYTF